MTPSSDDIRSLVEQIDSLLATPLNGRGAAVLESIERTLTDGYARALALEAERWRIERRIGEVAAVLEDGERDLKTEELSRLGRRLSSADGNLSQLRERLTSLRAHAQAVR